MPNCTSCGSSIPENEGSYCSKCWGSQLSEMEYGKHPNPKVETRGLPWQTDANGSV